MYDHQNSAAEDSVVPIFGTVAHTIMPAIPCYSYSRSNRLQLCQHTLLITLPVQMDGWEKFALKNQINICCETLNLYHAIYIRSQENSCPSKRIIYIPPPFHFLRQINTVAPFLNHHPVNMTAPKYYICPLYSDPKKAQSIILVFKEINTQNIRELGFSCI